LGGSMWKSLSTRPTGLVIFHPLLFLFLNH
jgi:hypothetical protein